MDQQSEHGGAEAMEKLDFLLATRIRYELHQRAAATPARPAERSETVLEEVDPEQQLRAAGFLLATRAMRESDARARQQVEGAAPTAPDVGSA